MTDPTAITPLGHVDDVTCPCGPQVHPVAGLMHTTAALDPDGVPSAEIPDELRGGVFTTFSYSCVWGCSVRVVETREEPHDCAGVGAILEELRDCAAGGVTDPANIAATIAERLAPMVREQSHDSWLSGIRDGRGGQLLYGVPEDIDKIAAEDGAR